MTKIKSLAFAVLVIGLSALMLMGLGTLSETEDQRFKVKQYEECVRLNPGDSSHCDSWLE